MGVVLPRAPCPRNLAFEVGRYDIASFPGLLRLQFLIACSMQKRREKARSGEFHDVIRGTADVTDSRRNSLFTFVSTLTEKLEN